MGWGTPGAQDGDPWGAGWGTPGCGMGDPWNVGWGPLGCGLGTPGMRDGEPQGAGWGPLECGMRLIAFNTEAVASHTYLGASQAVGVRFVGGPPGL